VSSSPHDRTETAPQELGIPAIAGMMLATSLAPLGSTMIAVALPRISLDTGTDVATLTPLLVTSYLITSIALQSPGGKLGDLIGHGRTLLAGLGLVAVGSVLGMLVPEPIALAAARILTAAGGAATVPATMGFRRRWRSFATTRRRNSADGASDSSARAWDWPRRSGRSSAAS
jgi:MFS family permease